MNGQDTGTTGEQSVIRAGQQPDAATKNGKTPEASGGSEERYRTLFDGMTEGFALHEILCDATGAPRDYRFLAINPAFERLTGLKREQVIGATHNDVLPNDDPKWVQIYGEVALTGKPTHFESYSSGLQRHYEVFAYRPAPRQFAVLFVEMTEHKKWEEPLESLARFPAENINPVLRVDSQGRLLYANQASQAVLRQWKTEAGGALPAPWPERVREALADLTPHRYEADVGHGALFFHLVPVRDRRYVNIYGTDITSLREAQRREKVAAAAAAETAAAAKALEAMEEGVLLVDVSGIIASVNPALERLCGWQGGDIVGRDVGEFLPRILPEAEAAELMRALRGLREGRLRGMDPITFISRDGCAVPVVPSASLISRSTGPIGVGCSRRTSRQPGPKVSGFSASSACR